MNEGAIEDEEPFELTSRQRLIFAIALPLVVVIVGVILIEVALRLAGVKVPGLYDADGHGVLSLSPGREGGAYPQGEWQYYHFDYDVPFAINVHGFREREPEPKAPGEWRIGIFGD